MASMKSWHIVVLDGWKTVVDRQTFSVADSRTIYAALKEEYDAKNAEIAVQRRLNPDAKYPEYVVKREWY